MGEKEEEHSPLLKETECPVCLQVGMVNTGAMLVILVALMMVLLMVILAP